MVLAALALIGAAIPNAMKGQEIQGTWRLGARIALLSPGVELDRWFVTAEGYHVHPASEDFTPGVEMALAYQLSSRIELEGAVLLGGAPVFVGIVDQNSTREPSARGRMPFMAVLARPNLALPLGHRSKLILGPAAGVAWTKETSVQAALGPAVFFGGGLQMVIGGTAGLDIRMGDGPFSVSARAVALSMELPLAEPVSGTEAAKPFGPVGLLLGVSYLRR
jgi:hypothetical protein